MTLCQQLQSEKDGIDRPEPGVIDKSKTPDPFAMDIMESITYLSALYKLLPMLFQLTALGRLLEHQGKIEPASGDSYARAALRLNRDAAPSLRPAPLDEPESSRVARPDPTRND